MHAHTLMHTPPLPPCRRRRVRQRIRRSNDSFSDAGSQRGGGSRISKEDHLHHRDDHGHSNARQQGKAELHLIGEISGASGFDQEALYCKWQLVYEPSKTWQVLRGLEKVRGRGSRKAKGNEAQIRLCFRSDGGAGVRISAHMLRQVLS